MDRVERLANSKLTIPKLFTNIHTFKLTYKGKKRISKEPFTAICRFAMASCVLLGFCRTLVSSCH